MEVFNPVHVLAKATAMLDDQVQCTLLSDTASIPLLIQPIVGPIDLIEWSQRNVKSFQSLLSAHGAILLRGFPVDGLENFEQFVTAVSSQLLKYNERSSPRTQVGTNIYTSTEYPASETIFLHNENSYQSTWPLKIFFYCSVAAQSGGETPIADCRRIYTKIRPEVRQAFTERQVMYVRNFGDGFGLTWQNVFQTEDKSKVEAYCRSAGITLEWKDGDKLRTRQVRPAIARHPYTRELTWFNHATFFHITTLDPVIQRVLRRNFREQDLPSNSYYGDGTPFEAEVMEHLRDVYQSEQVSFAWQQGDVLALDNMLVAHGRSPFAGSRKVLVAMSEPWSDHGLA